MAKHFRNQKAGVCAGRNCECFERKSLRELWLFVEIQVVGPKSFIIETQMVPESDRLHITNENRQCKLAVILKQLLRYMETATKVAQNPKANIMQLITAAPVTQIAAIPEIADRFKQLYKTIHPGAKSDAFYEAEKFHFAKLISEDEKIKACTKMSLYGSFMDVAVNGLSFDPSFKHLYLVAISHNAGTQATPKWEKRATLFIGGQGELVLRQMQGQIKYADNPVLVYEGDNFSFGVKDEKFFLSHVANLDKRTDRILACYIKLTRTDGTLDYKVITEEDMARFRKFSKDADKSKAWNAGIGGMWIAKCIKHAFKNYPKVRTGSFSQLASQEVDEDAEVVSSTMNIPDHIDYGTNGSQPAIQQGPPEDYGNAYAMSGASDREVMDEDFDKPNEPAAAATVHHTDEDF